MPRTALARTHLARTVVPAATATAAAVLVLASGCGTSTDDSAATTPDTASTPSVSATPSSSPSASPQRPAPATQQDVDAVAADVAEYAVALEQAFFANGYPQDLDGALSTARKLTNLALSPGNTIATYTFDPDQQEFQLCVESTSGASATYDTEPMSTIETSRSGGCP